MIIWVNGTFGVGKTATATELTRQWTVDGQSSGLRLFDPETIGYLLMSQLADQDFRDFQELPPWRALVPHVADEIIRLTGQSLVAVQTVLRQDYWLELGQGFARDEHRVFHVVLDADADALVARIDNDENGIEIRGWRHDHVERYAQARPWLLDSADLVVDMTTAGPADAAAQIISAVQPLLKGSPAVDARSQR